MLVSSENIKGIEHLSSAILEGYNIKTLTRNKLPLIEELVCLFNDLNLKNTLIIAVQHLCSTTEILFDALLNLKLLPENLYALGKCYSTNPAVLERLKKKGFHALPSSASFKCEIPFDVDFDNNVDQMIKEVLSSRDLSSFERILVLDDGGHLLNRANALLPKNLPVIGIEQTSSGFNRIKNFDLHFPVINLARSWLKLEHESPIIIALVLRKLKEKLSELESKVQNVLLIGYGVLGGKIYETLKTDFSICVFDSVPEKSMIKKSELKARLKEFDLIIGCTGEMSLTFNDFEYLKRPVTLASISSSDREFESFNLRKLNPVKNCHSSIVVDGITLLNCGFPITFDQDYDSIDTDDFQLTRALILASIYQASSICPKSHGFLPMNDGLQKIILTQLGNL